MAIAVRVRVETSLLLAAVVFVVGVVSERNQLLAVVAVWSWVVATGR